MFCDNFFPIVMLIFFNGNPEMRLVLIVDSVFADKSESWGCCLLHSQESHQLWCICRGKSKFSELFRSTFTEVHQLGYVEFCSMESARDLVVSGNI